MVNSEDEICSQIDDTNEQEREKLEKDSSKPD
jgi:hypothetical protein